MHGERTLAGRYRLGEVIGGGGMGVVYRATDLRLRRTVAVKVLSGIDGDESSVARFEREARAAARIRHPGVVTVYDAGTEHGTPFIVMQCVAGRSLEVILRDEGPLEEGRATAIVRQVASALAAAHRAGIVHRDVKPANVMVSDDGSATVLDFGVARVEAAATLTHTASVLGTPAYMSPEQALGEPADARSDIYALGCVLYAALAGRPPFDASAPATILHQHVYDNPEPPSRVVGAVSPGVDALVMHMLAKSPDARPQSAALVARSLEAELDGAPADQPRPVTVAATLVATPLRAGARTRRRMHRTGAPLAAVVAGVIAALVAGSLAAGGAGTAHGNARHRSAAHGTAAHGDADHAVSAHHAGRAEAQPPTSAPAGATGGHAGARTAPTGATPTSPPPSAPAQPTSGGPASSSSAAAGPQGDAVAAGASDHAWHGQGDEHGGDGHGRWRRRLEGRGLPPGHRVVTLLLGGDGQNGGSDDQGD